MNVTDHIRRHLLISVGLEKPCYPSVEVEHARVHRAQLDKLKDGLLAVGEFRYPHEPMRVDGRNLARAVQMITTYNASGNREFLIDAINYLEAEWRYSQDAGTYLRHSEDGAH
jgi:hypothetical protein